MTYAKVLINKTVSVFVIQLKIKYWVQSAVDGINLFYTTSAFSFSLGPSVPRVLAFLIRFATFFKVSSANNFSVKFPRAEVLFFLFYINRCFSIFGPIKRSSTWDIKIGFLLTFEEDVDTKTGVISKIWAWSIWNFLKASQLVWKLEKHTIWGVSRTFEMLLFPCYIMA